MFDLNLFATRHDKSLLYLFFLFDPVENNLARTHVVMLILVLLFM